MNRIVKIGMDVHTTNYTLCAMEPVLDGEDRIFANIQVTPDYKNVLQFNRVRQRPMKFFAHLNIFLHYYCGWERIFQSFLLK